jgi:hypothetical protein
MGGMGGMGGMSGLEHCTLTEALADAGEAAQAIFDKPIDTTTGIAALTNALASRSSCQQRNAFIDCRDRIDRELSFDARINDILTQHQVLHV